MDDLLQFARSLAANAKSQTLFGFPVGYYFIGLSALFTVAQTILFSAKLRRSQGRSNLGEKYLGLSEFRLTSAIFFCALASGAFGGIGMFLIGSIELERRGFSVGNTVAVSLIVISFLCIWIAANRTPRKLLVAVGAALAFVLGALIFELTLGVIEFIEGAAA